MIKTTRIYAALVAILLSGSVTSIAQSAGEATYKSKCAMCHGATGTPSAGMAKSMGVKPVSDPDVKKLTVDQATAAVKNGKGKMKPVSGLTDAQIKDVVVFYRSLK